MMSGGVGRDLGGDFWKLTRGGVGGGGEGGEEKG